MTPVQETLFAVWAILETVVVVISIFGNSVVIYVMSSERRLRKKSTYYVISIAAADFLSSVFVMILTGTRCVQTWSPDTWIPKNLCLWTMCFLMGLLTVSILQMTFVSVDRFWAICYPISYHTRSTRLTQIIIVLCWISGMAFGLSPLIANKSEKNCTLSNFILIPLNILSSILTVIIVVLYTLIYRAFLDKVSDLLRELSFNFVYFKAKQRSERSTPHLKIPDEKTESSRVISPHEIRATKTMSFVIGSFIICWIPLAIKNIIEIIVDPDAVLYGKDHVWHTILKNFCYCAVHFNSAIDPIIYAFRIGDVRRATKKILLCRYEHIRRNDLTDMSVAKNSSCSASGL